MRRRAVQTMEIAFVGVEKEVRVDRRLRECGYGVCNGRPSAEVAAVRRGAVAGWAELSGRGGGHEGVLGGGAGGVGRGDGGGRGGSLW
ncbi:histidine phosphatase family protein [Nonomuraea wenchangensis]